MVGKTVRQADFAPTEARSQLIRPFQWVQLGRLVSCSPRTKRSAAQHGIQDMEFKAEITHEEEQPELVGLRISAGLVAAVGCVFALYPICDAAMLCVLTIQRMTGQALTFRPESWRVMVAGLCVTAPLTYLIFRAASALRERRRWGAYTALLFGGLFLLISGSFVYDLYHPERAGPDEGFLILFVPFWFLIGLWWCVYLRLPHVRRQLRSA